MFLLGTVHKRVRSQGGRGCPFCEQGDSLDAEVRTFWCKKASNYSKYMVCPHEKGWANADKMEEEQFFAILWGVLFWTAPYMFQVTTIFLI